MSACQTERTLPFPSITRALNPGVPRSTRKRLDLMIPGVPRPGHHDVGHRPVADPPLGAVDHVLVSLAPRRGLQRNRIRPVVGLGQSERTQALHPRHRRQPALLLLLAAQHRDRAHRQSGLDAQEHAEAAIAPAQLHLDQPGRDDAHRRTPIALDPVSDQPKLAEPARKVERKLGALPVPGHHRQHLLLDEGAGAVQVVGLLVGELASAAGNSRCRAPYRRRSWVVAVAVMSRPPVLGRGCLRCGNPICAPATMPVVPGAQIRAADVGMHVRCGQRGHARGFTVRPAIRRRPMSDNATAETSNSRVRRATEAARSGLDVMLGEAATGGPPRFLAPGSGVKVGFGLARHPGEWPRGRPIWAPSSGAPSPGTPSSRRPVATGASPIRPGRATGSSGRLLQSYLAIGETVDGLISDSEVDWRAERRARLAAGKRARRARPDELPLVEPRRCSRRRSTRVAATSCAARGAWSMTYPRRRGSPRRSTPASSRWAATSPSHPGRWCCAPRCSSSSSTSPRPIRCERFPSCSSRRRSTSTTSSTSRPAAA